MATPDLYEPCPMCDVFWDRGCPGCQGEKFVKIGLTAGQLERLLDEARAAASCRCCTRCGKAKPLDAFGPRRDRPGGLQYWCRTCARLGIAAYRQTPEGRARKAEYRARPEVKERTRRADAARYERRRAAAATPRGKLLHGRDTARWRLRRAADPARRERLEALIALYDRELARIDRALDGGFAEIRHMGDEPR